MDKIEVNGFGPAQGNGQPLGLTRFEFKHSTSVTSTNDLGECEGEGIQAADRQMSAIDAVVQTHPVYRIGRCRIGFVDDDLGVAVNLTKQESIGSPE